MRGSSLLNAFRLLAKKPAVLLLLLPLQLALPLAGHLLSAPLVLGGLADPESSLGIFPAMVSYFFSLLGISLLMYLLAGFFLIPPAMEALHDGAGGAPSAPGWYTRGLRKHWWKPVTLGAMQSTLITVLSLLFWIVFSVFLAMISIGNIASSMSDIGDAATPQGLVISAWIIAGIFLLVLVFLYCMFAMLLPAMADRGFGASFKAVFAGGGFKKLLKVCGVYLVTVVVSAAVLLAFYFAWLVLSDKLLRYQDNIWYALSDFRFSWTCYAAQALLSFVMLFRYAYIFCVFQEIRYREERPAAPLIQADDPANVGEGL